MRSTVVTIKIGSSILLTERNKLDEFRIAQLASQIACLQDEGLKAILVVSGAVACGSKFVENNKQAAAGIGQAILTSTFYTLFAQKKIAIAQILLTKKDFSDQNLKNQLFSNLSFYLKHEIVPIINENDIVDLNSFGGNDYLAAEIATLFESHMIMLSSMTTSKYGVGGGETKIHVKTLVKEKGINMEIVDGKLNNILLKKLL